MANEKEVQEEGMGLLVAGIKALRDFLDGKAFFQIETQTGAAPPNFDRSAPSAPPGSVRRVRFMRDQT